MPSRLQLKITGHHILFIFCSICIMINFVQFLKDVFKSIDRIPFKSMLNYWLLGGEQRNSGYHHRSSWNKNDEAKHKIVDSESFVPLQNDRCIAGYESKWGEKLYVFLYCVFSTKQTSDWLPDWLTESCEAFKLLSCVFAVIFNQ